jgi:prevent-host-death family protein
VAVVYSAYEAKAKFSELIRRVCAGQRVIIAYRGKQVAQVSPIEPARPGLDRHLERLEEQGILSRYRKPSGPLKPMARRPGALARFLESRE